LVKEVISIGKNRKILISIFIGVISSLIFVVQRQSVQVEWSLGFILILSLLMRKIEPKWTCLAYVIPLIYLVDTLLIGLGIKRTYFKLDYKAMLYLVGVLHFVEGILTFFFGGQESIPIITYKGKKTVGGYEAVSRWLMPLLFFSIKGIYIPILVEIVYANDTFTTNPEVKARKMGILIGTYGITLLLIDQLLDCKMISLTWAMIWMPLLHEMMFFIDRKMEEKPYKYVNPDNGIRIMDVLGDQTLELRRGDIILSINGILINDEECFWRELDECVRCTFEIESIIGEKKKVSCAVEEIKKAKLLFLPMY